MPRTTRYSPEVRERAGRMLAEHRGDYPSEWAAMTAISAKLGMTAETLRIWVRRAEIDEGKRPNHRRPKKVRELEQEVKELRRANEILKGPSMSFATELDGRTRK